MLEIKENRNNDSLTLQFIGRLDSISSIQADTELKGKLDGIIHLTLDLDGLSYVSSAGLRIILALQKQMNWAGVMVVKNVHPDVMEILEMTGFKDILRISE